MTINTIGKMNIGKNKWLEIGGEEELSAISGIKLSIYACKVEKREREDRIKERYRGSYIVVW